MMKHPEFCILYRSVEIKRNLDNAGDIKKIFTALFFMIKS